MRKYFFLAAGLSLASCQATSPLATTGIYATAAAFRQQQPSLRSAQVNPAFVGYNHVIVVKPAGRSVKRLRVASDSIWGYRRANGVAYRLFQHRAYKVSQADSLSIYSVKSGKTTRYYFSEGLAGPVQRLAKKKLQEEFASNPTFVRSLDQIKWYQRLEATEPHSNRHTFRVVALYRKSLQAPH